MNDPFLLMLISVILTGIASLSISLFMFWLQRRRPQTAASADLLSREYRVSFIHLGPYLLFCILLFSVVITHFVGQLSLSAVETQPGAAGGFYAILQQSDAAAEPTAAKVDRDSFYRLLGETRGYRDAGTFVIDLLMVIPLVLLGRYVGHRSNALGILTLLGAMLLAWAVIAWINSTSATEDPGKFEYGIHFYILHILAALAGFAWGAMNKRSFQMLKVFRGLDATKREQLIDSARRLMEQTPAPPDNEQP